MQIKISQVVRSTQASRVVNSYMHYWREESEYQCLSGATLFKILKMYVASQKRNIYGLDYIISEGMKVVDVLQRLISKLQVFWLSHGVSACLESLRAHVNQHLKLAMKSHIESKSLWALFRAEVILILMNQESGVSVAMSTTNTLMHVLLPVKKTELFQRHLNQCVILSPQTSKMNEHMRYCYLKPTSQSGKLIVYT